MSFAPYIYSRQKVLTKMWSSAIRENRLGHAYLLVGEEGAPLKETAVFLAKSILCDNPSPLADESCHICTRIDSGSYPDFILLDGADEAVKKEQVEGLESLFSHTALEKKGIMVYVINLVENMTEKAAQDVFTDREKRYKDGREWHHHSLREERRALRRFPYILAIQDEERRYFSTLAPDSEVWTVYTSFPFVEQPVAEGKNILFFSGRNNFNINGIRRFIRTTLPLLAERGASIRLLIGGDICSVLDKEGLPGNITLAGKYDSPADFYRLGNIAINPVYEGTGLKIKTFEAIAHGKTTIADPHSAKGIYRPELAPLITATTPEEYADSILRYIDSPDAIEKNRERCRSYIESLNSYIQAQYRDIFDK